MISSSTLSITLQNDTLFPNTYNAEDISQMPLRGSIVLSASTTLKIKKLSLQFNGKLSVQFPASIVKTRRELVNQTVILLDHDKATTISGQHTFPFELLVPRDLPESFHGEFGKIRYTLKAIAETSFISADLKTEVPIYILRNADVQQELTGEYATGEVTQDKLACNVTLPTAEYTPGEKFDIQISTLPLEDGVNVSNVICTLKEYTQFHIPSKNEPSRVLIVEYMKRLDIISRSLSLEESVKTLLMKVPEAANCSCVNQFVEIYHILNVHISWESEGQKGSTIVNIPINVASLVDTPELDQLPKYQVIEQPPTYNESTGNLENRAVSIYLSSSHDIQEAK